MNKVVQFLVAGAITFVVLLVLIYTIAAPAFIPR